MHFGPPTLLFQPVLNGRPEPSSSDNGLWKAAGVKSFANAITREPVFGLTEHCGDTGSVQQMRRNGRHIAIHRARLAAPVQHSRRREKPIFLTLGRMMMLDIGVVSSRKKPCLSGSSRKLDRC
jgi:hypothetical protein